MVEEREQELSRERENFKKLQKDYDDMMNQILNGEF